MTPLTAKIGEFELALAPLERSEILSLMAVVTRIQETQLAEFKNLLGYVFLAARKSDPSLCFADLCDAVRPDQVNEIFGTITKLAKMSEEHWRAVKENSQCQSL